MAESHPQSAALVREKSRDDIARIASVHGARNIRVFGSAGRGEATAHDLDLLVEMADGRSLFDLIRGNITSEQCA